MIAEQSVAPVSGVTTGLRYAVVAFAWLFALGSVIQVFLIGLYLFEADGGYLSDHTDFGHMIGVLAYVLPILALIGRVGRQLVGHAVAVTVVYIAQIILPTIDQRWIAALHPLNAFLVIGSAVSLGRATLELIQAGSREPERA
jgi:hypothetical protein